MGAVKKYLSDQFRGRMLYLEHEEGSDFYLSSFQNNHSALPLLIVRIIMFLGFLGMLLSSIILSIIDPRIDATFWPAYMTHWGIVFYLVCTFFGCWVSVVAYTRGSIDTTDGLPWYAKVYWVSFNIAVPIAFYISTFYYVFLAAIVDTFAVIDPILELFTHGISAILMMCLLLSARHPSHMAHYYQPFCASIVYLAFMVIYYLAGGTDPNGNPWIYPNMDFREPATVSVTSVVGAAMLLVLYILIVLMSLARDWCSKRYIRDTETMSP